LTGPAVQFGASRGPWYDPPVPAPTHVRSASARKRFGHSGPCRSCASQNRSTIRIGSFEVKHDGFRALAHIDGHHCDLVSRNGHTFKHWPQLCEELAHAVRPHGAVIDGEIVCLHARGRSNFKNLVVRARVAVFLAVPIAAERSRFCPGYTAVGSTSGSTCHTAVHSRQRRPRRISEPLSSRPPIHRCSSVSTSGLSWRHGCANAEPDRRLRWR